MPLLNVHILRVYATDCSKMNMQINYQSKMMIWGHRRKMFQCEKLD